MLTSISSFYVVRYKHLLSVDDGLDIFAIHGMGGFVGDILTGLFADRFVPALDGVSGGSYAGGWWNRNFRQLGLQLAGATTCAAWSFVVSCLLLLVINKVPGLHLRASEEHELRGLDVKYLEDIDFEDPYFCQSRDFVHVVEDGGSGSSPAVASPAPGQEEKRD